MNKPQFVLEEALEAYLSQIANPLTNRSTTFESIVDLTTGILIGIKAARGEILKEKVDADTDKIVQV